jgi:hypothetical protein
VAGIADLRRKRFSRVVDKNEPVDDLVGDREKSSLGCSSCAVSWHQNLTIANGEWEVVGQPYTTAGGKNARVRVQAVGRPAVTELRTRGAHERIGVKRSGFARRARFYLIMVTNSRVTAAFPRSGGSVPRVMFWSSQAPRHTLSRLPS